MGRTFGDEISGFWDKTEGAAQGSVPPSFRTLRHNNIGTDIDRISDVIHVLTLANQECAGCANFVHKGSRIAEG